MRTYYITSLYFNVCTILHRSWKHELSKPSRTPRRRPTVPQCVTVRVCEQQAQDEIPQPANNSGMISINTSRWVIGWLELVSAKRLPVNNAGNSRQRGHAARALRDDFLCRSARKTSIIQFASQ